MNNIFDDTIVAPATAPGVGAIAIIRVSGSKSIEIVNNLLDFDLQKAEARKVRLGRISGGGQIIDSGLITVFKAPHSYTGEDVVEISVHGGPLIVRAILDALIKNGARLANHGEFTQRAFLKGKMDLLQAESVADIINAQTEKSLAQAQNQLSGILSHKIISLKSELKKQAALLEVELDFSEEDIEFASRNEIEANVENLITEIVKLLKSFQYGKILREGFHIVLTGRPNVGKSSILNTLLEEDRAIVSETPGTTRDVIEESLDIDGYLFKISDTAGIRHSDDLIEKEGVKRARMLFLKADLIVLIEEAGDVLDDEDREVRQFIKQAGNSSPLMIVHNKIDLVDKDSKVIDDIQAEKFCRMSAKTGEGFDNFKKLLVEFVRGRTDDASLSVINKTRHKVALEKALASLRHAKKSLQDGVSSEFIALDIRGALDALGEIAGEVTTDDILNDIFSSFCIGK